MIRRNQPGRGGRRSSSLSGALHKSGNSHKQTAEQHALTMLETIPDGLMNVDQDFRFVYLNAAAERILKKGRQELLGKEVCNEFPEIRGTDLEQKLRHAVEEAPPREFEASCSRLGDYYQVFICSCEKGAMVLLREATERKQLRDALEESRAWRELIIQNVKDFAIYSMDVSGRITLWNPGSEKIFGYKQEEMIGQPTHPLFVPEDREAGMVEKELTDAREFKCAQDERWHLRKDGTRLFLSGAVVPLYNEEGELRGFTKVARDVTEKKKLEDELVTARQHLEQIVAERTAKLRQSISELEVFSYSISHDLRGPLRTMRSFAQILSRTARDKLDARSTEYLDRISAAADRLDRLIQEVLDYSRVGRVRVQMEPVDLESLVSAIIQEQPALDAVQDHITLVRPLHKVVAHKASLTQALSNLLTNAVKFVSPGTIPAVRVRTEVVADRVRIWIEDNGIGVPEAHRDRIFGLFQRTPEGESYEGTGIGLAIVRKAIEAMGGRVGVESQPEQGSSFWIELPGASVL
jgi:PAS domain S-box-containing protein